MSNKYAGKYPKMVSNNSFGYKRKETINIGLDQVIGKSAIYNEGGSSPTIDRIQIIGGNELETSGIQAIVYAESVTVGVSAYDADVDVEYVAGLGNGWLIVNGIRQPNRVLVRHDFIADQTPLLSGRRVAVSSTVDVSASGGIMKAYTVDWL